jgi:hypothetical protein
MAPLWLVRVHEGVDVGVFAVEELRERDIHVAYVMPRVRLAAIRATADEAAQVRAMDGVRQVVEDRGDPVTGEVRVQDLTPLGTGMHTLDMLDQRGGPLDGK